MPYMNLPIEVMTDIAAFIIHRKEVLFSRFNYTFLWEHLGNELTRHASFIVYTTSHLSYSLISDEKKKELIVMMAFARYGTAHACDEEGIIAPNECFGRFGDELNRATAMPLSIA